MQDRVRTLAPRRWRALLALAAAANLVLVGLAAAPSQAWHRPSLCAGTAAGLTISGDLAVPEGQACELVGTTVTGDVVVRAGATLLLDGSTVRGDLTVLADGFVTATESRVDGNARLRQAFGTAVVGSALGGGVDTRDSGFLFGDGSTFGGRVFSRNGQTVILSGRVDGEVRTSQDVVTDLHDVVVTGRVDVDRAAAGSVVCRSEIDGRAVFRGTTDLVQIGSGPVLGCEFNVFGAGLTLRDNDAVVEVSGNVVRGDLACTGNAAAPSGSDNRVRGEATGQCADLATAAAPSLSSAPAADLDSRIADLVARIEGRTADAAAAVAAAGPADLG